MSALMEHQPPPHGPAVVCFPGLVLELQKLGLFLPRLSQAKDTVEGPLAALKSEQTYYWSELMSAIC